MEGMGDLSGKSENGKGLAQGRIGVGRERCGVVVLLIELDLA
jgi:hypothetical protein